MTRAYDHVLTVHGQSVSVVKLSTRVEGRVELRTENDITQLSVKQAQRVHDALGEFITESKANGAS